MKKVRLIYIFPLLLGTLSSCSDVWDEKTNNEWESKYIWTVSEVAQGVLNNAYRAIPNRPDNYGNNFLDAATDNALTSLYSSSVYKLAMGKYSATDNPLGIWSSCYQQFQYINSFLENGLGDGTKYDKIDADKDAAYKKRLKGEAYFLRAYNYFCLSRNFGLVPMHYGVVETLSQTGTPLANNMDEIYDLMIDDCKKAEELLPVYAAPIMGRIDRVGAQALLAKIYLYAASAKANNVPLYKEMAKDVNSLYQDAMTYAGRALGLDPDYPQNTYGFESDLLKIYDVENFAGKENIFLMSMDRTGEAEGQYSKISKMFLPYIEGATIWIKQGDKDEYIKSHDGWGEYRTEMNFYNEFDGNDLRKKDLIVDKVYNEDGTVKAEWKPDGGDFEYPFCRKYIDPKVDGDKTSTRPFLIRFTDIAMVYAEAAGPTTKAYELINFIRHRAGLGDLTPGLPIDEFREKVYEERKFEMAFEGDRMYDIRRWGRIGEIKEVKDAGLNESQYSFYPLPQTEINLNPSLRE